MEVKSGMTENILGVNLTVEATSRSPQFTKAGNLLAEGFCHRIFGTQLSGWYHAFLENCLLSQVLAPAPLFLAGSLEKSSVLP